MARMKTQTCIRYNIFLIEISQEIKKNLEKSG